MTQGSFIRRRSETVSKLCLDYEVALTEKLGPRIQDRTGSPGATVDNTRAF